MDEDYVLVVSRPVAACSRCKKAKTRCDGNLPACGACEKAGVGEQCSSRLDDEFARGRERSWVATLETRTERLQQKLNEVRQRRGLPPVANTARISFGSAASPPTSPPLFAPIDRTVANESNRNERADVDDLIANFGVLSVNAAARDFHGFTDTMSYARLVLAAAAREPIPFDLPTSYPSRHEAVQAAKHYLDSIFRFLPVFEEVTFWAAMDAVYHPSGKMATITDHYMVRMVLAISFIIRSRCVNDQNYWTAVAHLAAALECADPVIKPGSLPSIQALLLLVEYARYDPRHFDVWSLVGAACRAMVDMGLHQDPVKGSGMSKAKLRERRLMYHCVYVLDRSLSIAHDLAFSFSDASANVQYPRSDGRAKAMITPEMQIWSQPHEALYHIFRLRRIQSEIYQETCQSGRDPWIQPYESIWPWWHKIQECRDSFPSQIVQHHPKLLERELLTSRIFLLAPCPRVPVISELAQSLIFESGLQYAAIMSDAIDDPALKTWLHSMDAIRARKVARIFLDVLALYGERLLQGTLPDIHESLTPRSVTAPQFPYPPRRDNADRSIYFIHTMSAVLGKFSARFGISEWKDGLDKQAQPRLEDLAQRRLSYPSMHSVPTPFSLQQSGATP